MIDVQDVPRAFEPASWDGDLVGDSGARLGDYPPRVDTVQSIGASGLHGAEMPHPTGNELPLRHKLALAGLTGLTALLASRTVSAHLRGS